MLKYQKTRYKGKLIVFEGLSGSGKTECSKLLANELTEKKHKVWLYNFNSFDNSLLVKLYEMLDEIKNSTKNSKYPKYQQKQIPVDYLVIHSLFMLHIISLRKEIFYKLSTCDFVIVDQWIYKNIAYSILNKVPKNYIMDMVRKVLPKPYMVIFLDIHENISLKKTKDLYEDRFTLQEVKTNYYNLRRHAKERWLTINLLGNESIDDIVYEYIIPKIKTNK